MNFVLTHTHLATFWSVSILKSLQSQARLTLEFFTNELPEQKEFLADRSSLSFLLSQALIGGLEEAAMGVGRKPS